MTGIINVHKLRRDLLLWLEEDMPFGDITSQNIPINSTKTLVTLIAKENGTLCGAEIFDMVFSLIDDTINTTWFISDGGSLKPGLTIATLHGPLDKILMGERLALNLLQRMSGIATVSAVYAEAAKEYNTKVVDTRKTTPGLRQLEKYAVKVGGCYNHRFSLSDAVMVKDNHIKAAGSITRAIKHLRDHIPHTMRIEVEVETLTDFKEALQGGADIIMLDNMSLEDISEAVTLNTDKALIEASGNMTLDRIPSVAATGVDIISVGALTHSVRSLDISLKFKDPTAL